MKSLVFVVSAVFSVSPAFAQEAESEEEKREQAQPSQPVPQPVPPASAESAEEKPPEVAAPKPEEKPAEKSTVTAVMTPEQLASLSGVQVNVTLDHAMGQGTFIDAGKWAYLGATIDASMRYAFSIKGVRLAATARGAIMYEYTMPDSPNGRRVSWRDLSFGLSAPAVFKEKLTGIAFTPSFSAVVPITLESWQATMVTVLGLGVSLNRVIGPFIVGGSLSGSRGLFLSPVNGVRRKDYTDGAGNLAYIGRSNESYATIIGNNATWGVNSGLNVTWMTTDELSFYVSYALRLGWRDAVTNDPNDPYNPQAMTADGQPVANVGMGRADTVVTSIGANYQLSEHWAVTAYVYSVMPPKSSSNGSFRFPFWAIEGGENNYSYVGLSLSAGF